MKEAFIITDLSFGDAGKGTTVDFLAREQPNSTIIRYNGGPQAAHNVITPDGRHHTFSQFGSGSFVPGTRTFLSQDMLVNPITMTAEAAHLQQLGVTDIWDRLTVDENARVITPWHIAVNRLRERARGDARHGSCAHGVGETMADDIDQPRLTIHVKDIATSGLAMKLDAMRRHKLLQAEQEFGDIMDSEDGQFLAAVDTVESVVGEYQSWSGRVCTGLGQLAVHAEQSDRLIFEGAQGALLDEWYGFHPYTTWSTTTPENARRQLSEIDYNQPVTTLGIIRAYTTRHGPGPFPTEEQTLSGVLREYHNDTGEWQGAFRYGYFDAVLHRYAIEVSKGVSGLVVTGLDRMQQFQTWQYADRYEGIDQQYADYSGHDLRIGMKGSLDYQEQLGAAVEGAQPVYESVPSDQIMQTIESTLGSRVLLASSGPTSKSKHWLRAN